MSNLSESNFSPLFSWQRRILSPFELLRANVTVVPVLFHTVLHVQELFAAIEATMGRSFPLSSSVLREVQQQREHFQATIQAEQTWISTRRTWLNQRQEWLSLRQEWLFRRMMWILQLRELPDAQLEWLEAQRDWLAQQQEDVKQQQRWVQHHRYWLDQRQRRLDQLIRPQPFIGRRWVVISNFDRLTR